MRQIGSEVVGNLIDGLADLVFNPLAIFYLPFMSNVEQGTLSARWLKYCAS